VALFTWVLFSVSFYCLLLRGNCEYVFNQTLLSTMSACRTRELCCRWRKWSRWRLRIRFHWRWPTRNSTPLYVTFSVSLGVLDQWNV